MASWKADACWSLEYYCVACQCVKAKYSHCQTATQEKKTTGCNQGFGECLEGEVNQMSVCVKFGYVGWKWMCDGFRPYLLAMLWYAAHVGASVPSDLSGTVFLSKQKWCQR